VVVASVGATLSVVFSSDFLGDLCGHEKKSKNHQKLQILPERNQVFATADFCEKGFFLTSCASAVSSVPDVL
jgi:hypothetical protein